MLSALLSLDLLRAKRQDIIRMAHHRGAHNVRVIGSVARGEADAQSDIDLMVDFEPGRTLLDHAGLIVDLEKLLGTKVDVADAGALRPAVKERVMRDAREL